MTSSRCIAIALLLATAMSIEAAEWRMLPDRSRLDFFVNYSGQEAPGRFRQFSTEMAFDPTALADARLVVTVTTLSADLDSADINEAIAGPEWFDFTRHMEARFVSESIVKKNGGGFVAAGKLQLKGTEQVIDVPFTWEEADGIARMRGELMLQRGTFAIGTGEWAATDIIGGNVRVRFDVALESGVE